MRKRIVILMSAVGVLIAGGPAFAQAELAGTLRGTVTLADGSPVPGVQVTAASPALQGERSTVSNEQGQWLLRNLPPGSYTVTFELEGMATVQSTAAVRLGQDTPVNVEMSVAAEEETIIVTGESPSVLASSEVSTTYDFEQVNRLPIGRDPDDIAALAPAVSTTTPNAGQLVISGAFAYDNVFLIDGVDANDNLFGTSNPVYIEDAIADVQVLTSGISAEYGRFTGGVVNVITKSGGNEFSGTLRADLTNNSWRERTPLEKENGVELEDEISEELSATFGGYLLKDRLWFFTAGRDEGVSEQTVLSQTGIPTIDETSEDRFEGKLTWTVAQKHQFQGTYTDREQTMTGPSFTFSNTPSTIRTRTDPSELKVGRYAGVLTPSLFAELQISEKEFTFINSHGLDASTEPGTPSFIENSPFFDFLSNFSGHYNAPYFDGKDPEDRNNEQLAGTLSTFLDTSSAGSHDLKVGFEDFTSFRTGGNSQSPTNWVMSAAVVEDANGDPVLTADNELTPVWQPFASGAWRFDANRQAKIEIQTRSAFVNDRWQLNDHWSFNVGFRYEEVTGESDAGIVTVDSDALVPRLGASYDLRGDGKYRFDVTYAQYSGKYSESQFAQNTDVGNPPGLLYFYLGPPGVGYDFAPAYDFNNELAPPTCDTSQGLFGALITGCNYAVASVDDGRQTVLVDEDVTSPTVDEVTLSAGMELERGGFLKAIYTNREYSDLVEDFITPETGSTEVIVDGNSAGFFSRRLITNSDLPTREYEALQLIGRYRLADRWTLDGNLTWQIKNEGNFEGEAANQPASSSVIGDYPEIRSEFQHYPTGRLASFGDYKARIWTNYSLDLRRAGSLNLGLLANWDSGGVTSTTSNLPLTPTQVAILAENGYVDQPTNQTIYYGTRGDLEFDDSLSIDLSINYQLPIWKDLRLWLKADVLNLFNDDAQISGNDNIAPNFDGPVDELGLPTTFVTTDSTGDPFNNDDFAATREYRFTVGFRF
jgi:hypothetical protein